MQITVEQTESIDEAALIGQMQDAAREAIDKTAQACVRALEAETLTAFDRPTPWAQHAFAAFKASEHGGDIDGLVFVKTAQTDAVFDREIFGGTLSAGDPGTGPKLGVAVPGPAATLNAFGGLDPDIVRGAIANGTAFFHDLPDGNVAVLERSLDGGLDLLATFVKHAHYKPLFPFFETVEKTALNGLAATYSSALSKRLE